MNARKFSVLWHSALLPVFAVSLGYPNVAYAEGDTDAAETAAARTLAIDGVKLAQAGQCDEAFDKLDRAEKLKHSPIILRYLGECQIKLGHWVEGSESLRKLLREPLPESASPAMTEAYESAATTLEDVKPRIPSMKIVVSAPRGVNFTVKVDGREVANSAVGVALPTDPGDHTIEVTAPGFLKASSPLTLAPHGFATVALELKRDPSAAVPTRTSASKNHGRSDGQASHTKAQSSEPLIVKDEGANTGKVLGYVSYGVAAAGLGVGIFFGQSAMRDERTLRDSCPGRICPVERGNSLEFAKTKGLVSTIGFAVAGGGLTLGTILLLTSSGSSSSEPGDASREHHTATNALRPRVTVGLGSVALATDF